jgi:hypothetical protein
MKWVAKSPGQLLFAQAMDGLQANVSEIGKFAGDLEHSPQSRQVARGDAQHFALLEMAQAAQGDIVVGAGKQLPGLAAQSLLAARISQRPRHQQRRQPIRMRQQQFQGGLRAAQKRRKNAGLFSGYFFQSRPGGGGLQLFDAVARPRRVR